MSHASVTLSQVETFDSATAWQIGNQNLGIPTIRPNIGPNGTDDFALQTSSSVGSSAASRLIIFNTSNWAGDYTGSGVTGLSMDLRNTGSSDLFMRIAVNGPGGWFVTDGQAVNTGLGYATYLFDLSSAGLSPAKANGPDLGTNAAATLADVTQIRILHSFEENSSRGEVANATLRIDNITAIPEPRIAVLTSLALIFFIKWKR
jgi:hypothetical protein